MAKKKWMKDAAAAVKHPGVCTGSKFGGPTCRPGTPRYNLAKAFRAAAKKRKKH